MNRFAKRFMEYTENRPPTGLSEQPMIALHKKTCDSPADLLCRPSNRTTGIARHFGGGPFPFPGCLALREVLMDTAPLSSDSILTAS